MQATTTVYVGIAAALHFSAVCNHANGQLRMPKVIDARVISVVLALAGVLWLLSLNQRYNYGDLENTIPILTAPKVTASDSVGRTYRFNGTVASAFRTRQNMLVVQAFNTTTNVNIEIPIFPSLGRISQSPSKGDSISVVGNLGFYRGRPQLRPLSLDQLQISRGESPGQRFSLTEALRHQGATAWVGPVVGVRAEKFTSRSGREHIRFTVREGALTANGILFQGDWAPSDIDLLRSGRAIRLQAKIDSYRGQPSLVTSRIQTVE